ncbi:MAG TPA: response regulator transcription factor [Halothiobacillaceae bacterium]|nr:response regulator transcription factor [Halothiobacillaceae bacterium]
MKVLLVDDEPLARARLRRMIMGRPGIEIIGEAANTQEAEALLAGEPDLVLLDVAMPGESGIRFAERLREQPLPPAVIFTTAHPEHALDATQSAPAGFLVKPIEEEDLFTALDRARQRTRAQCAAESEPLLSVQIGRETLLLPVDAIIAAIAEEKTTHLHFFDPSQPDTPRQAWIDESLKQLSARFESRLLRLHRSVLVNPRYLSGLLRTPDGQTQAKVQGIETPLPVSRRLRPKIKELLF